MRKILTTLAAAATIAAVAAPTTADARRGWRGPPVGGLAAGAPYQYFGGSYNYGQPAPVYYDYIGAASDLLWRLCAASASDGCWRYRYGYRYRVC